MRFLDLPIRLYILYNYFVTVEDNKDFPLFLAVYQLNFVKKSQDNKERTPGRTARKGDPDRPARRGQPGRQPSRTSRR